MILYAAMLVLGAVPEAARLANANKIECTINALIRLDDGEGDLATSADAAMAVCSAEHQAEDKAWADDARSRGLDPTDPELVEIRAASKKKWRRTVINAVEQLRAERRKRRS